MNAIALILVSWALLAGVPVARAEGTVGGVSAEITLDHEEFVPGEPVRVGVRIINRSSETLQLGGDKTWLKFAVEAVDKRYVKQTAEPDLSGAFALASSTMGTKRMTLTRFWDLQKPGRYIVSASLQIPSWSDPVQTQAKAFDITPAFPVKAVAFGVPGINGRTNAEPETCHYVLEKLERHGQVTLYCAVTDQSETRVYGAVPLCEMPDSSRPEIQVDPHGNAHVLVQTEVKVCTYYEINFVGAVLARQTYRFGPGAPGLGSDASGNITILRAVRERRASDLPPPEPD